MAKPASCGISRALTNFPARGPPGRTAPGPTRVRDPAPDHSPDRRFRARSRQFRPCRGKITRSRNRPRATKPRPPGRGPPVGPVRPAHGPGPDPRHAGLPHSATPRHHGRTNHPPHRLPIPARCTDFPADALFLLEKWVSMTRPFSAFGSGRLKSVPWPTPIRHDFYPIRERHAF